MRPTPLWQYLLTTALTFVGSGLAAAIVGALFKRHFDNELEHHKAWLMRGSAVHALQVKAITDMYARLTRLQSDLASWNLNVRHKSVRNDLRESIQAQYADAELAFPSVRLLLPAEVEFAIYQFLTQEPWISGRLSATHGLHEVNAMQGRSDEVDRSNTHDEIDESIYGTLGSLLKTIAVHGREVIHGQASRDNRKT